jgi:lactate permease
LGGLLFLVASAFLGWVAVFLPGSDTSVNALFGNLQVVAANQLKLNPFFLPRRIPPAARWAR